VPPIEPLGKAHASADGATGLDASTAHGDGVSVVAVAAGDGIERLLGSVLSVNVRAGSPGTVAIVRGGQSANPSTGELLRAIREAPTRHVIVLPNNPNVKLAAQQAAALVPDKRVAVVATRNAAEGIAALLSMDPTRGSDENAKLMLAAARGIQSLQVTDAVRDAKIGRRKVKKGQTIVLDPDDGLVAVGGNRRETVLKGLAALRFTIRAVARTSVMVCRDAPAAIRESGVEALLVDQMEPAGGAVAEHMGLPFITICNALAINRDPVAPPPFTPWSYHDTRWARLRNQLGYAVSDRLTAPAARAARRLVGAARR
jgi:hypothetical protein